MTDERSPQAMEPRRGAGALKFFRQSVAPKLADLLRSDPERLRAAIEMGLVRREWLEDPSNESLLAAPPREVVQRFLEREVERRPSTLAELGLTALGLLDDASDEDAVGERTPLAVAFADLAGFTTFTANEGDEAASEVVARNGQIVGPIVRSRGGRVVKRMGDGFMLSFPAPEAAVLGSLEIVGAVNDPLPMRAGAHWGEPIVTRGDLIGHDVNVAARVTDTAAPGEVLVTQALRESVSLPGLRFGDLELRPVKGLDEPVAVCRAEAAS